MGSEYLGADYIIRASLLSSSRFPRRVLRFQRQSKAVEAALQIRDLILALVTLCIVVARSLSLLPVSFETCKARHDISLAALPESLQSLRDTVAQHGRL